VFNVLCRKRWMKPSCYLTSHLKSELGSTGIVSPFVPSDHVASWTQAHSFTLHRLGISGRLVSSPNRYFFRRLCLHRPSVPPQIGIRWEMASGQSTPAFSLNKTLFTQEMALIDARSDRVPTEHRCADSLCQSGARVEAFVACYAGYT
jgi:hypothetical protein